MSLTPLEKENIVKFLTSCSQLAKCNATAFSNIPSECRTPSHTECVNAFLISATLIDNIIEEVNNGSINSN